MIADFKGDLERHWREGLAGAGYDVPDGADAQRVSRMYLNVLHRQIAVRPRNVMRAKELIEQSVDVELALERISEASKQGADLNPFLSHRLSDAEFNDGLLSDWGIHHLHLSPTMKGRGDPFGGLLLFLHVSDELLHFIAILDHRSFSKKQLLDTVESNWPVILDAHRRKGVTANELTDQQRANLRAKGGLSLPSVGGHVVAPPGGGYTSSGLSVKVLLGTDRSFAEAKLLETLCRNNSEGIAAGIEQHPQGRKLSELRLRLRVDQDGLHIVELQTGIEVRGLQSAS